MNWAFNLRYQDKWNKNPIKQEESLMIMIIKGNNSKMCLNKASSKLDSWDIKSRKETGNIAIERVQDKNNRSEEFSKLWDNATFNSMFKYLKITLKEIIFSQNTNAQNCMQSHVSQSWTDICQRINWKSFIKEWPHTKASSPNSFIDNIFQTIKEQIILMHLSYLRVWRKSKIF